MQASKPKFSYYDELFTGRGAVFHFRSPGSMLVGGVIMGTFRILVADDHEVVRKGLVSLLQAQPDWQVCGEAGDGREAVEKAQQLKPDVVILDIGMPSLNGLEATRQILRHNPQAR